MRALRVTLIAALMRAGAFERGRTYKRLAVEWGLSRQYMRLLTAEASKRVRASTGVSVS